MNELTKRTHDGDEDSLLSTKFGIPTLTKSQEPLEPDGSLLTKSRKPLEPDGSLLTQSQEPLEPDHLSVDTFVSVVAKTGAHRIV